MENKTGFDLTRALEQWRARLATNEYFSPENIREFESHVRETISELSGKGLSEEEAFEIAARRFGKPSVVGAELEKSDPMLVWKTRLFWMLIGCIALRMLNDVGSLMTAFATYISVMAKQALLQDGVTGMSNSQAGTINIVSQLIVAVAAPVGLWFGAKKLFVDRDSSAAWRWRMPASRVRLGVILGVASIAANFAHYGGQLLFAQSFARNIQWRPFDWILSLLLWISFSPWALGIIAAYAAPEHLLSKRQTDDTVTS